MHAPMSIMKSSGLPPSSKRSFLHREEGILNRGNADAFALEESQNLSIFFATNSSITQYLKKSLEETLPVAPLYGDVQIRFADWVRQLTHYDPQSGRAPANTRKRRPQWASRLEWRQSTLNTSASSQTSPDTTMREGWRYQASRKVACQSLKPFTRTASSLTSSTSMVHPVPPGPVQRQCPLCSAPLQETVHIR